MTQHIDDPNAEKYLSHLSSFKMSRADKLAVVHMICKMTENIVDQAFGMDTTSLAVNERSRKFGAKSMKMVNCNSSSLSEIFDANAENAEGTIIDLTPKVKGNK